MQASFTTHMYVTLMFRTVNLNYAKLVKNCQIVTSGRLIVYRTTQKVNHLQLYQNDTNCH